MYFCSIFFAGLSFKTFKAKAAVTLHNNEKIVILTPTLNLTDTLTLVLSPIPNIEGVVKYNQSTSCFFLKAL